MPYFNQFYFYGKQKWHQKEKKKKFNDLIAREREKSLAKLASSPDLVNERVNLDSKLRRI